MVKHTQAIRRLLVDKLFGCLTILWGWRLKDYLVWILNQRSQLSF